MRAVVLAPAALLAGCGAGEAQQRSTDTLRAADTRPAVAAFAQRCARKAGDVTVAVLCPERLPTGGFEWPRDYGESPRSYLIDLEPRGFSRRAGTVFHLLFGGTCRRWDLRTRDGGWTADPAGARGAGGLRLVGMTSLVPGQTETERHAVGLRALRRARVGSAPALVLRNPPYPTGGIHGGHLSVSGTSAAPATS